MSRWFGLLALYVFLLALHASAMRTASGLAQRDKNLPARLPYVFPNPGTSEIADHIRARRNGTLLALDGILLNAPAFAQGEDALFGVVRDNNTLPPAMRELFILRTAVLNSATYQWLQHFLVGFSAGLTKPQLETLHSPRPNGAQLLTLTPDLRAALTYADEVTKSIKVKQKTFDNLHRFLNDQQMVEATMTIAGYNLISRFVVALDIDGMADVPIPSVNASFTISD